MWEDKKNIQRSERDVNESEEKRMNGHTEEKKMMENEDLSQRNREEKEKKTYKFSMRGIRERSKEIMEKTCRNGMGRRTELGWTRQ